MRAVATSPNPGQAPIEAVDNLPADVRQLVHEYGYSVVNKFFEAGVTAPPRIRELIRAVHLGAREPGNKRLGGKDATSGLDAWLITRGATFTAHMVVRALRDHGYTVIPTGATTLMQDVFESCAGTVKQKMSAALFASDRDTWGDL